MNVAHVNSVAFCGIEVIDVDIQVQLISGIPAFVIVGLPDKTIAESKERVKAALASIGIALPAKRILINLSPADLIKEGSHFDLAIATALLANFGAIPIDQIRDYIVLGELSLDGSILSVSGILPTAMHGVDKNKGVICPSQNSQEALWSGNNNILTPNNLISLINHFKGTQILSPPELIETPTKEPSSLLDLSDINGQQIPKRALEICAAGGHHMLMIGSPGAGKSMLAQRLPSIMPPMSSQEILECSMIASISGLIKDGSLINQRPFRAPHHSCSVAAMVGGGFGKKIKPGEVSLSQNGILFLDELPEFSPAVLESLRQPIESGEVLISRAGHNVKYPANFQLIAAMNPCKCGYLNDPERKCRYAHQCGISYQSRISGPMMDRFDMHVVISPIEEYSIHPSNSENDTSAVVAKRVAQAREIQKRRYKKYGILTNSKINKDLILKYAIPTIKGEDLLNESARKFRLSMRSYIRILRVARTIADLEGVSQINKLHIAEAISYRQIDYKLISAA